MWSPSARNPDAAVYGRLDTLERVIILALYIWLVTRLLASMSHGGHFFNGLLLISEGLVILFLVTRRASREMSFRPYDWALALLATACPLIVSPSLGRPLVSPVYAACLWSAGTFIQVMAKLTLGRSFGCVAANRGLKSGGPYHFVRHPMYSGYVLSHVAFWLVNPTWGNLFLYLLCNLVQIPRIMAEERLLSRDPGYRNYCLNVPWRVLPGMF